MSKLLCSVTGHTADTVHHHNQGLDFASCHRCECDLIRAEGGDWTRVPKGFRVVWREFGRHDDAGSVAARMAAHAQPPRRRTPRNAIVEPPRDRRNAGKPMPGLLALMQGIALARDIDGEQQDTIPAPHLAESDSIIRLPAR